MQAFFAAFFQQRCELWKGPQPFLIEYHEVLLFTSPNNQSAADCVTAREQSPWLNLFINREEASVDTANLH